MSKTALVAALAIALGSATVSIAAPGGHGGGGGGGGGMGVGGGGSGGGMGGGAGAMGMAHGPAGRPGLGAMAPGTFNRADPMANAPAFNRGSTLANRGMVTSPTGRNFPSGGNWAYNNWHHGDHDHHHHHRHGNAFS